MSLARSSPSLHRRIASARSGPDSVPARELWIKPPAVDSYAERYRGTEYETGFAEPQSAGEPLFSDGRLLVITSAVLTVVAGAGIAVFLG